jgi:beta-lactamase superfamily II metal-dependent hydrolase
MFRIDMLPAGHGDCLWIEYGDPAAPRRVLIDGGPRGTYKRILAPKLHSLSRPERRFELLVITHIDADHIAGALELLQDKETGFAAADVWFNGYRHLPDEHPDTLGPVQGEVLTDLLRRPGVTWNGAFGKAAVVVPPQGTLPQRTLEGGLVLTVLSPTPGKLATLKPTWGEEVRKAGLDPNRESATPIEPPEGFQVLGAPDVEALVAEPFSEDAAEANGSSIALLAEFEGRRVLLCGDAHPSVLTAAIKRLGSGVRLALDACKLSHHGSKANVHRQFLEAIDCPTYLFSTNGAYFKHPDRQAVARVITWGGAQPRLHFNYRSACNAVWDSPPLRERHGYSTAFPRAAGDAVRLQWL